jgi:hypothetical protein
MSTILHGRISQNKVVFIHFVNLQELPPPRKLDSLGLSHSRLNERYHSMEKVNASHNDVSMLLNAVSNKEYMTKAEALLEEQLESVSQRGENSHRKYSRYADYRKTVWFQKSCTV